MHDSPRIGPSLTHAEHLGEDGHTLNGESTQNGLDGRNGLNLFGASLDGIMSPPEFNFNGEMGPAADISTFPPTMAPTNSHDDVSGMLSMDSILSNGFWDSVLVPGL